MSHFQYLRLVFFIFCFFVSTVFYLAYSQKLFYDFGFKRDFSVKVFDEQNIILKYPWVGGLNACQFCCIDLNGDGIKDLFIFDRSGNKILTFINTGSDYVYSPEYKYRFPVLTDWVQLADYNKDGKEDIFTYGIAGIAVYKNISTIKDGLKFKLITNTLNYYKGSNYSNIPVTSVDYPVISDIDNDGDMDILTFSSLRTYVDYYKNISVETFGNADSLYFKIEQKCWGAFAQSSIDNQIILNVQCPWKCNDKINYSYPKAIEHIGATLLALDIDNDGDKDLIIGDYDYPNLTFLTNGGTSDSAYITNLDVRFPSNTKAVDLMSFPATSYLDIDNDNVKDIIVSSFDPTLYKPDYFNSVWLYKNTGTNNKPVFTFQMDNFMQKDMIDLGAGAYPIVFDYDSDGINDLIVANYGYRDTSYYDAGFLYSVYSSKLALFRNSGTNSAPEYHLITRDYAEISKLKIKAAFPAFADMDGDGDLDMLLGNDQGAVYYFENIAAKNNPADFVLRDCKYQNIDAGNFSTPQLVDVNGDSLIDLICGNQKGTIYYYKNIGTKTKPQFDLITTALGNINVRDTNISWYGYSVPYLFKDKSYSLKLFVGSELGTIFYFSNIDNNLSGTFYKEAPLIYSADSLVHRINEGMRTSITVTNIYDNGYLDIISGNFAGGLAFFKGVNPPEIKNNINMNYKCSNNAISLSPNPATDKVFISFGNIKNTRTIIVDIYNIVGRKVLSQLCYPSENNGINIHNLTNGVYLIKAEGRNIPVKFVKL